MRSSSTQNRGRIALIRKGSGQVVGVADLVEVIGPLDAIARRAHRDKHCIPKEQDETSAQWNVAWVLENAKPLVAPVPYNHKLGAVIWVNLDDSIASSLRPATGAIRSAPTGRSRLEGLVTNGSRKQGSLTPRDSTLAAAPSVRAELLPFANDGTWFGPHLVRGGKYKVGAKGNEEAYLTFAEALEALRRMPSARWRRPNPKGNWGIVTAVRWARPARDGL